MTYCVGLRLNRGLVFMSDTRTNAGLDDIATYRKTFTWSVPGERVITVLTAGNLATSQQMIGLLNERAKRPDERDPGILHTETMFQVAQLVSSTLREVIAQHESSGQSASAFGATVIVGGQIAGMEPRLFMCYPEGNFIESSSDTQFLQIGETKYGRPIILRSYDADMSFATAIKLLLVSLDSTVKSNLSVGLPVDLSIYETDSLVRGPEMRIERDDPYYQMISSSWGDALRTAFDGLPAPEGFDAD